MRSVRALLGLAALALFAGCDRATPRPEAPAASADEKASALVEPTPPPAAPDEESEAPRRSTCPQPDPGEPYSAQVHGERLALDAQGLGPIRLGMTLDEARRAMPEARFERSPDADGVAFVGVMHGEHEVLALYAGEDDPEAPIDWTRRIESLQTFSPAVALRDLAVGDPLTEAEGMFGPVREIVESEIESRQFVSFERQPGWLGIRIDYSGDFAPGSRHTTRYCPGARILSFHIDARP